MYARACTRSRQCRGEAGLLFWVKTLAIEASAIPVGGLRPGAMAYPVESQPQMPKQDAQELMQSQAGLMQQQGTVLAKEAVGPAWVLGKKKNVDLASLFKILRKPILAAPQVVPLNVQPLHRCREHSEDERYAFLKYIQSDAFLRNSKTSTEGKKKGEVVPPTPKEVKPPDTTIGKLRPKGYINPPLGWSQQLVLHKMWPFIQDFERDPANMQLDYNNIGNFSHKCVLLEKLFPVLARGALKTECDHIVVEVCLALAKKHCLRPQAFLVNFPKTRGKWARLWDYEPPTPSSYEELRAQEEATKFVNDIKTFALWGKSAFQQLAEVDLTIFDDLLLKYPGEDPEKNVNLRLMAKLESLSPTDYEAVSEAVRSAIEVGERDQGQRQLLVSQLLGYYLAVDTANKIKRVLWSQSDDHMEELVDVTRYSEWVIPNRFLATTATIFERSNSKFDVQAMLVNGLNSLTGAKEDRFPFEWFKDPKLLASASTLNLETRWQRYKQAQINAN